MPSQRQTVRAFDIDIEPCCARARRLDRQRRRHALLGREFERRYGIARQFHRSRSLYSHTVITGFAFNIIEVETHRALVAAEQKARQRRCQHNGIADDHIRRGAAEFGGGPCDRHHPRGAGEFWNLKGHGRVAGRSDRDDPRIQRERFLRRRTAAQFGAGGIAARADCAARALHPVDQLAVKIAQLRAHAALPEIIIVGCRRFVIGEIQDADIDSGDDDLGIFARIEAGDFHRQLHRGAGPHQSGRRKRNTKRARGLVDAEPFQPERPARHPLRGLIERPAQRRDDISAGAPILANGNLDLRSAFLDLHRLRQQQPIADDVNGQPAGGAGVDRNGHIVTGRDVRPVDRGLQEIRRVSAAVGIPADIELHGGQRPVGIGGADLETIAARLWLQCQPRGFRGRNGEIAIGDAAGRFDRLVIPG